MSQTKKQSMVEVCTNTGIGMLGSWIILWTVMGLVDNREMSATVNVVACTIWSLVRGYFVRRHFNGVQK